MSEPEYRDAMPGDATAIAALHADSWRRHYRGAYSDAFLDGDVYADRLAVWTERLTPPRPAHCTIVAMRDGALTGFAHTAFDRDTTWGSLLDNLHVDHGWHRHGIATELIVRTARRIEEEAARPAMYLWVLEQNTGAQAFYAAMGGTIAGRELHEAAGGGSVMTLRCVWDDLAPLIARP